MVISEPNSLPKRRLIWLEVAIRKTLLKTYLNSFFRGLSNVFPERYWKPKIFSQNFSLLKKDTKAKANSQVRARLKRNKTIKIIRPVKSVIARVSLGTVSSRYFQKPRGEVIEYRKHVLFLSSSFHTHERVLSVQIGLYWMNFLTVVSTSGD